MQLSINITKMENLSLERNFTKELVTSSWGRVSANLLIRSLAELLIKVQIQHMIKHLNANLPKNGKKKKNLRGHVNDGHFSRWPWIWSIYLWYSRQQWQQWLDMSWTFLLAPCHTSRISQSLNWENGILTICWAGFKFHWLRGEMLLLDCSSRAEDIGAFNLFQQVWRDLVADYLKKLLPTRIRLSLEAGGNLIKYKAEDVNAMMKQYLLLTRDNNK